MEWAKQTYNTQYEKWVPWLEDKYLAWFGENKSSYVAKGTFLVRACVVLEFPLRLPTVAHRNLLQRRACLPE
jgi:hypothetical protein